MSGIPVYTQSPTRAPNAAGTTPMTSSPQGLEALQRPHNNYAPTTKSTPTSTSSYPEAQPGAAAVPAPTGAVVPPYPSTTQYTPTRTTDTRNYGPPAPQPGASPVPYNTPGLNYELPPPPKAGEVHHTPSPHHQYPYQLDYEMGSNAYTARPPAAVNTTTTTPSQSYPIALPMGQSEPINSDDEAQRNSFENPPGYVQNPYASLATSSQRETGYPPNGYQPGYDDSSWHKAGEPTEAEKNPFDVSEVWNTAKKWAVAAGDKLSETEEEIWRRVNGK